MAQGRAGSGGGPSRDRHGLSSLATRAHGVPGSSMHPSSTHTSSQLHAFSNGQASPGETASAGWAVRGEFSSISSPQSDTGWWPPGGEKGLEGVAGGLGERQGLFRPGGLFVTMFPGGAPAGLSLLGLVISGWFFFLIISLLFFLDLLLLLLILTHVFPLLILPLILALLALILRRSMGRGWGLRQLREHKAGQGEAAGPRHPHTVLPAGS